MSNEQNNKNHNLRGRPSHEIANELLKLAINLSPDQFNLERSIVVYRFDGEDNELGEQFMSRAALAKAFHEQKVIGAKNGKFKVLV